MRAWQFAQALYVADLHGWTWFVSMQKDLPQDKSRDPMIKRLVREEPTRPRTAQLPLPFSAGSEESAG